MNKLNGFTVIELMIALALGAFLLMGLVQIFTANKQSNNLQVAFSRVQESGRIASEIIARDIRKADFWGCTSDQTNINDHLDHADPDYDPATSDWLTGSGVNGIDNASSVQIDGLNVIDGSDVLILKTSSDACKGLGKTLNSTVAAALHVSDDCELDDGMIAIITNCKGGEMFTVTLFNGQCGGGKCTVVHNTGANPYAGWIDNATKNFSQKYGAEARILIPIKKTYFIANGAQGDPSLYVKVNNATSTELVSGIEDLQILYGEDTDIDKAIEVYDVQTGITSMDEVLSIRVSLSVTSTQRISTQGDGLLRKNFVTTSTVRNRIL
jgi:type IV pilus assembly protein PilW